MKAHVLDSKEPLKEGKDYQAICGEDIAEASFVYTFDSGRAPEFLAAMSALNTCPKCYRIPTTGRYVYGLIPGKARLREARCPRCGIGVDTDGDGNCLLCAGFSDSEVQEVKLLRAAK